MANLTETSNFDDVTRLDANGKITGYNGSISGTINAPLQNLTNRTKWLKDQVSSVNTTVNSILSSANPSNETVGATGAVGSSTAAARADHVHAMPGTASQSADGFLSKDDKKIIDGISAAYAPIDSPTFTGSPKSVTPTSTSNDTSIATTAFVKAQAYAPIASPEFTGSPKSVTPASNSNSTSIATTAFVKAQAYAPINSPEFTGSPKSVTPANDSNDTSIATTAFVKTFTASAVGGVDLSTYAPIDSPTFTGSPKSVTPANDSNDTSIATTAFVKSRINEISTETLLGINLYQNDGTTVVNDDDVLNSHNDKYINIIPNSNQEYLSYSINGDVDTNATTTLVPLPGFALAIDYSTFEGERDINGVKITTNPTTNFTNIHVNILKSPTTGKLNKDIPKSFNPYLDSLDGLYPASGGVWYEFSIYISNVSSMGIVLKVFEYDENHYYAHINDVDTYRNWGIPTTYGDFYRYYARFKTKDNTRYLGFYWYISGTTGKNTEIIFAAPSLVKTITYNTTVLPYRAGLPWVKPVKNESDSVPVGTITYFAASTPPEGYLECDGSVISKTQYPDLAAVIGITYGGTADNPKLPDLRGEFIRGWDHGKGTDSGRAFGSSQTDEFKSHTHGIFYAGHGSSTSTDRLAAGDGNNYGYFQPNSAGGNETRPRNIALLPCIKAFGAITVTGNMNLADVATQTWVNDNFVKTPAIQNLGTKLVINDVNAYATHSVDLFHTRSVGVEANTATKFTILFTNVSTNTDISVFYVQFLDVNRNIIGVQSYGSSNRNSIDSVGSTRFNNPDGFRHELAFARMAMSGVINLYRIPNNDGTYTWMFNSSSGATSATDVSVYYINTTYVSDPMPSVDVTAIAGFRISCFSRDLATARQFDYGRFSVFQESYI